MDESELLTDLKADNLIKLKILLDFTEVLAEALNTFNLTFIYL